MANRSEGPTFFELARQALSSTRRGYDLLAPKFEQTPYATPQPWIDRALEVVESIHPLPPNLPTSGADIACGTGRGARALRRYCDQVDGYDFSPGMLEQARRLSEGIDGLRWLEADLAEVDLPREQYHRIVTFGAWGHILPSFRTRLLDGILLALRPGGVFLTLTADDPALTERRYWFRLLFDLAIRLRNLLWFERFHMYYRLNSTESLVGTLRDSLWDGGGYEIGLQRLEGEAGSALTILTVRRG